MRFEAVVQELHHICAGEIAGWRHEVMTCGSSATCPERQRQDQQIFANFGAFTTEQQEVAIAIL